MQLAARELSTEEKAILVVLLARSVPAQQSLRTFLCDEMALTTDMRPSVEPVVLAYGLEDALGVCRALLN